MTNAEIAAPVAAAAMATVVTKIERRLRMVVSPCLSFSRCPDRPWRSASIAADPARRRQNPWRCLLSPGADRVPLHRRGLRCATPASSRDGRSCPQRSAARSRLRFASSLCLVNSSLAVHGCVHTVGSSTVTTYSSVVGPGPRPALDEVQVLARARDIGLRAEVRHVDDQRVALPMPARIAVPLADVGRQVRRLPFMTMLRCQPWP